MLSRGLLAFLRRSRKQANKALLSSSLGVVAPSRHALVIVLGAFDVSFLAAVIEFFVCTAELSRYAFGWKDSMQLA